MGGFPPQCSPLRAPRGKGATTNSSAQLAQAFPVTHTARPFGAIRCRDTTMSGGHWSDLAPRAACPKSATGSGAWPKWAYLSESDPLAEDHHHANGHKETHSGEPDLEAADREGAGDRLRVGSRHARVAQSQSRDRPCACRGGRPSETERLQRSGRKEGSPGPQIPPEILGNLGVDARTDHGSVRRAREIFRPRRGGGAAGD